MDRAWNLGVTGGWVSVRVIRYKDSARKEILSGVSVSAVCYHVTFLPRSLRHVYLLTLERLCLYVRLSVTRWPRLYNLSNDTVSGEIPYEGQTAASIQYNDDICFLGS